MRPRAWSLFTLALVCAWLIVVALMVLDHRADPYDPSRAGPAMYGHNHRGALGEGLLMTLVELVVFLAVVRPWQRDRSLGRPLAALILFAPWSLLSIVWVMHAGGIMAIHATWALGLTAIALGCLVRNAGLALRHRQRGRT